MEDKRIPRAINARFRLVDFIRNSKEINPAICGFSFIYNDEITFLNDGDEELKAMWKNIAYSYSEEMLKIPYEAEEEVVEAIKDINLKTREELKNTYVEAITRALAEIIGCNPEYDYISISKTGIHPYVIGNLSYKNDSIDFKYVIPNRVSSLLWYVYDYDIIKRAMLEVKEKIAEYEDFISFDYDTYTIGINIVKE